MNRLRELDFIRVIAALSVIVIHITAPYVLVNRYGYYINQGVRYAVPVFLLISGLLLMHSYSIKELKLGDFLKKRFNKILIPYIIWTLVYVLYKKQNEIGSLLENKTRFLSLMPEYLLFGTGFDHLCFIIIIIQMYLLFPILYSFRVRCLYVFLDFYS